MDKIHKFKKEVLNLKIYSQINYYPGNPYYIGKLEDERLKKSIEESSYKDFISEKNQSLYGESTSNEPVSQYYVEVTDEAELFDILEETLHSTDDFTIDDLKVAINLLESYKYDAFLEELDLLNLKFLNAETTKEDEHRFKTVCRKQFGYSIPKDGKITTIFVNSLRQEMEKRIDYLESLKEMIEKVLEIKDSNEAIDFSRAIDLIFFPNNDPEIQSLIDCNIERNQVKPLFEFIDFLYFNRAELVEYNNFVGEYERLKMERENMSLSNNYKAQIVKKEIDHKIEAKKILIRTNITESIIKKLEFFDAYDVFEYDSDGNCEKSMMSGIDNQKKYCTPDAFKLIQIYEDRYIEFREATKYNHYDCFELFDMVDNMLEDLFSFVHEDEESKLKVSKEKHLEDIKALSVKSASDKKLKTNPSKMSSKDEGITEAHRENKSSITSQTKSLFNFIDFLHSNIDNFNQYLDYIYDMNRAKSSINYLGTHFTDTREKKDLQKKIDEKWDVIFRNIVNPIKEKVAELDVFNWYKPETLLNKHIPLVSWLSKNYDDQDLNLILKAKKQYIEYTNEVSPYVIKQTELIFIYLNKVMSIIAKDFEEEGDLPIYTEVLRVPQTRHESLEEVSLREELMLPLLTDEYIQPIRGEEANLESLNLNDGRKNMEEQEIFEVIKELTKEEYIEKSYRFLMNGLTPKGVKYSIIIHVFKEMYSKLNDEFKVLFFNGKVELLQRIKILLQKGLQKLKLYYDDEGHFLEIAYEDGDKEFIESTKTKQHIFKTKIYYVNKLLLILRNSYEDNLDETPNISELVLNDLEIKSKEAQDKEKVVETINAEELTQHSINLTESQVDNISVLIEDSKLAPKKNLALYEGEPLTITSNPPSFNIPLTDNALREHFNELVKKPNSILHHNTDFHHFCYAFSGNIIPKNKLPYKTIELVDYNKSFYNYLNDKIVKSELKKQQKYLPNSYKTKAKRLFYDRKGKPLNLSNPN